jgi:hypothetical protein
VQCSLGGIEVVFQALDLLAHAVTFATIPVPVSFRPVPFTTQPLILPLAPLQLGDQLLARSGAPVRLHAPVMPEPDWKYKRKLRRSRRSDCHARAPTR